MDLIWRRPKDIPYPKVYRIFHVKDIYSNEQLITFTIQDLTEDRFEDAIQEMTEHFLRDENTCRTTGIRSYTIFIWIYNNNSS